MQPIRKVIADVMRTLGAYRDIDSDDREIVERWLQGVFMAASIKKSDEINIRASKDGTALEALVHTSGAECGTDRIRPLEIRHAQTLKSCLCDRAEVDRPQPRRGSMNLGAFEESVGDIAFTVKVYMTALGQTETYHLLLEYVTH